MQNIGLSGYLQSEKYRFFTAGRIQRNLCFVGRGFQRGRRPLWQRKCGISIAVFILLFLCGEASNETGRFRGGGIQRGLGLPWHTILLARSSVLYLLRQGAAKGTCDGAAQGPFGDPGQAGFAGHLPENEGAFEKQSPPGRQRLCALGWSEAEEKRVQPGRRWYIKSPRPSLKSSRPPSLVFSFFQNGPFHKMQKCVTARRQPSRFSADWDSPDRAKSGSPDLRNGAFSSYPIPRD